jgi:hypothetical protein
MSNLIPFDSNSKLPSFMQNDVGNLAAFSGGAGYPVVSIKGKVFHIKRGEEQALICKPGEDEPAASIEVLILAIGPNGKESAKTYYPEGYTEGSSAKPTCVSDNGITPNADAAEPQAKKCAICPHNASGSKPTATNPKGKACGSSKRLAIATVDAVDDPMLLRVPGASIVALSDYLGMIKGRGVPNSFGVVTKIGFDYSVAHPALTFKPVGFVDAATYAAAKESSTCDVANQITGASVAVIPEDRVIDTEKFETPKIEAPKPAPAPKPKAAPKVAAAEDDDLPTTPKAVVKVEGAAKKPEPKAVETIDAGMSSALDDLDFDD